MPVATASATKIPNESSTMNEKVFNVDKIYVKKTALEIIDAPESFLLKGEIKTEFEFNPEGGQKLSVADTYEATLNGTIKIKIGDKELAKCSVSQSGIFKMKGFNDDEQKMLFFGHCPDLLYPYLRQTVSTMLAASNLPPVILNPVSFMVVYQQQLEKQKQEAKEKK